MKVKTMIPALMLGAASLGLVGCNKPDQTAEGPAYELEISQTYNTNVDSLLDQAIQKNDQMTKQLIKRLKNLELYNDSIANINKANPNIK